MNVFDKLLEEIDNDIEEFNNYKNEDNLEEAFGNALKNLRIYEKFFRIIFIETNVGVFIGDIKGRAIRVNRALCRMLGYSEEELNGLKLLEITHSEDKPRSLYLFDRLFKGNLNSISFEGRLLAKDGRPVWTSINGSLVSDNGLPLFFTGPY